MDNIDITQMKQSLNELKKIKNEFSNKVGEEYKTLRDRVYSELKKKIIFHDIKPGERIIDKNLAKSMGVSRSLMRQTFTILEKEELIDSEPRSGFYVKEISAKDIAEIYDIRKVLEKTAAEASVPNIPDEEIEKISQLFELAKEDLDNGNFLMFVKADTELHKMIINNYGNKRMVKLIKNYNDRFLYYRIVDLSRAERAKKSYYEHLEILEAVKNKDVEKVVKLMGAHIENAKYIIISNFKEYNNL